MGVFLLIPPPAQKVPAWRTVWPDVGASGGQGLDRYFFACPGGSLTLISRPGAFSLLPGPSGAVGSGTGAVVCRTPLGCVSRFRLRARLGDSITPSPAPATSNRTGGFPASGSPRRRLPSGLCIRSVGACFRAPVHHAVVSKEALRSVHNRAAPPLPAESLALALLGRQSPHLAFDLVLDFAERRPRVADTKVVHPSPRVREARTTALTASKSAAAISGSRSKAWTVRNFHMP